MANEARIAALQEARSAIIKHNYKVQALAKELGQAIPPSLRQELGQAGYGYHSALEALEDKLTEAMKEAGWVDPFCPPQPTGCQIAEARVIGRRDEEEGYHCDEEAFDNPVLQEAYEEAYYAQEGKRYGTTAS